MKPPGSQFSVPELFDIRYYSEIIAYRNWLFNDKVLSNKIFSLLFSEKICKAKWKNLRDAYKKCNERRKTYLKSGSASKRLPECRYFKWLTFISDTTENKETTSNITLVNPPTCTSLLESGTTLNMSDQVKLGNVESVMEDSPKECTPTIQLKAQDQKISK